LVTLRSVEELHRPGTKDAALQPGGVYVEIAQIGQTRRGWVFLGLLAGVATLAAAASAESQAASERMTKVVVRQVVNDGGPTSAGPQTLYRIGSRYGRMEHPLDTRSGVHALVVVAAPDYWFVDLSKRTARHGKDPQPDAAFRAPVVRPEAGPPLLQHLEFGREFDFLTARGATVRTVEGKEGGRFDLYETPVANLRVVLLADPGQQRVRELAIHEGGHVVAAYRYDAYETDLAPDRSLFKPPSSVRILEQVR